MDFPPDLEIYPATEFEEAQAHSPGTLGVELTVQVQDNGRMLDHWCLTLGGSAFQRVCVRLTKFIQLPALEGWNIKFQFWARDVTIRRNMTTSIWVNISKMINSKEAVVTDDSGEPVAQEAVLGTLQSNNVEAAIRWAVVIGEDERLRLHTQLLPTSAESLSGKPVLRG